MYCICASLCTKSYDKATCNDVINFGIHLCDISKYLISSVLQCKVKLQILSLKTIKYPFLFVTMVIKELVFKE